MLQSCAQLDKEKGLRRKWNAHDAQKEIFQADSAEFKKLNSLRATLEDVCADPASHRGDGTKQPSRRLQLVGLRNEIRTTIETVDKQIEAANNAKEEVDPVVQQAREKAKERMKLPMHLRGSAVLNQS